MNLELPAFDSSLSWTCRNARINQWQKPSTETERMRLKQLQVVNLNAVSFSLLSGKDFRPRITLLRRIEGPVCPYNFQFFNINYITPLPRSRGSKIMPIKPPYEPFDCILYILFASLHFSPLRPIIWAKATKLLPSKRLRLKEMHKSTKEPIPSCGHFPFLSGGIIQNR